MKEKAARDATIAATAAFILALCLWGFHQGIQGLGDDTALPQAGPRVLPASQGLAHLLNIDSETQESQLLAKKQRLLEMTVELDSRVTDSFHRNLKNIAAQRGWHAATVHKHRMNLTLPAGEIGQLAPLLQDPVGWIHNNHNPGGAARAPDPAREMITTELRIREDKTAQKKWGTAMLFIGTTALAALLATIAWGLSATGKALDYAANRRTPAGTSTRSG